MNKARSYPGLAFLVKPDDRRRRFNRNRAWNVQVRFGNEQGGLKAVKNGMQDDAGEKIFGTDPNKS
jgi:hypothetical protein